MNLEIMVNNPETKIVMLSTKDNLQHLADAPHVLADGTFKFCSKFFAQFYVVHAFSGGVYTPCAFFLLPDKTKETYVRMLEYIVEESSMRGISFIPLVFHVDLEFPAHQALLERFPHCQIQLCLFHLGQAWYRNITTYGLIREYKDKNSWAGYWLRILFGVPALPADEVQQFVYSLRDYLLNGFQEYLMKNKIVLKMRAIKPNKQKKDKSRNNRQRMTSFSSTKTE